MKELELLPIEEISILKIIRVEGPEWNKFVGYLPYKRTFYPGYDQVNGDIVDEKLLNAIKGYFPNSISQYKLVLFKGELIEYLKTIRGNSSAKFTLKIWPEIPYEIVHTKAGQTFHIYGIDLKFRVLFKPNKSSKGDLDQFFSIELPFEELDEIAKTITAV
jgi:hypothetical protein